jgi:hypothetical protein
MNPSSINDPLNHSMNRQSHLKNETAHSMAPTTAVWNMRWGSPRRKELKIRKETKVKIHQL